MFIDDSLIKSKITSKTLHNHRDLEKLIDSMDMLIKRGSYNQRVKEYKNIVYNYTTDYTPQSLEHRPYTLGVPQKIEYWVTTIQAVLWNYSESPFSFRFRDAVLLKLANNQMLNDSVSEFYRDAAIKMTAFFADIKFNFKLAFSNFLRDWFELGMGIMRLNKGKTSLHLTTVCPEKVSFTVNEDGQYNNILIYSPGDKFNVFELFSLISDGEFEDEVRWEYKIIHSDSNKITTISTEILHFQPIFISMFNVLTENYVGWGKGLEALPIIKSANNLFKSMNESASVDLQPLMVVPTGSINFEAATESYAQKVSAVTATRVVFSDGNFNANPLQFPVNRNYQIAEAMLQMFTKEIEDLMTPNKLIVAKGIARMTAEEARMRDSYDKNEITFITASVIDDTLIPLIRYVFDYAIIEKKGGNSDVLNTIRQITKLPDKALKNFSIDLKNLMGDKQVAERTQEISSYIQILGAIVQIAQTKVIDVRPLIAELGTMYSMAGSSTEGFISELNDMSQQLSGQTAQNIQQNNTTT